MNNDELIEILKEFHNTRYDKLEGEPKRLFDAIIKIADERDIFLKRNNEAINFIKKYQTNWCEITNFDYLLKILTGDGNE